MPAAVADARRGTHRRLGGDQYLQLAHRLANEATDIPSRHFAVAHISIADVARAAGVTRGALYRLWPSQQDFWNELVEHLLEPVNQIQTPSPFVPYHPTLDIPGEIPLDAVMDAAQDMLLSDPLPLLRAGIVGYARAAATAGRVHEERHDFVDDLDRQIVAELHAHQERCIDGLTTADLAVMSTVLGNGLPITGRMVPSDALTFDSAAFRPEPDGPRSLLGVATAALRAELTEHDVTGTGVAPSINIGRPQPPNAPLAHDQTTPSGRRQHYLRIAVSLALDPRTVNDYGRVLGNVTLDALARAANTSRRTLTNIWAHQAQFRLDLFSHLLQRERQWVETAIRDTIQHGTAISDAELAFLTVGDHLHRDLMSHVDDVSFLAFAPLLDQRDISERALHDHNRHLDRSTRQLRHLLVAVNRRPRPGVSLRHLVTALFTYADGANRFARTHRTLLRDEIQSHDQTHTTTGYAVAAILNHTTEPLDNRASVIRLSNLLS